MNLEKGPGIGSTQASGVFYGANGLTLKIPAGTFSFVQGTVIKLP